jgi:hypothetical protein
MPDADEQPTRHKGNGYVVLRIVLGIIFLLPGACGGLFYGVTLAEWANSGFLFGRGQDNYSSAILIIAIPSILLSIVLVGILLRYARIQSAPTISLVLSLLTAFLAVSSYLMMHAELSVGVPEETMLVAAFVAGFAIAGLPPFLHWRSHVKTRNGDVK